MIISHGHAIVKSNLEIFIFVLKKGASFDIIIENTVFTRSGVVFYEDMYNSDRLFYGL